METFIRRQKKNIRLHWFLGIYTEVFSAEGF